jgi:hypothetical protein
MSSPRHQDHRSRIAKSTLAAIFTLSISGIFLGISIISYTVIQSREDLKFEQMQRFNLFSAQQSWVRGDFLTCIIETNKIFRGSSYAEAQSVKKDCQNSLTKKSLDIVQQLQDEGKQEEALTLVAPLAEINTEAKRIMEEIAAQLLAIGQRLYQERSPHYYNDATYSLLAIPSISSYYSKAQTLIQQWYEEFKNNRDYIQAAQAALEQEAAAQAQQALAQVSAHPFWQDYIKPIQQDVEAFVSYENAEALMERHEWKNAIAEVRKLPNSGLWVERKSNLISRAEATLQRQEFCKTVTLGLWQKCYR